MEEARELAHPARADYRVGVQQQHVGVLARESSQRHVDSGCEAQVAATVDIGGAVAIRDSAHLLRGGVVDNRHRQLAPQAGKAAVSCAGAW